MYKDTTLYDKNIFIDFIKKVNEEDNGKLMVHLKSGEIFIISPTQRVKVVNSKFLKIIDEKDVEIKLFKINNIIGIERL